MSEKNHNALKSDSAIVFSLTMPMETLTQLSIVLFLYFQPFCDFNESRLFPQPSIVFFFNCTSEMSLPFHFMIFKKGWS